MRTTVTLDSDVYDAAMQLSRVSGERLGKVLSELARRGLQPPVPLHDRNPGDFQYLTSL